MDGIAEGVTDPASRRCSNFFFLHSAHSPEVPVPPPHAHFRCNKPLTRGASLIRDSADGAAMVVMLNMVFYIYHTGGVTAAKRLWALVAAQVEMAGCDGEIDFAWSKVHRAGDHASASAAEASTESSRSNAVRKAAASDLAKGVFSKMRCSMWI